MKYPDLQDTNRSLTGILDEVATTQTEIVITRNGKPVARIVPWPIEPTTIHHYPLRGIPVTIAEDFNELMPELWEALGE